jgi:acyl-CoA oxidase
MSEEREKATFDVRELTYFLDGGEKFTQIREKFMMELERDPTFRMYDMYDVTKDQIRERTMEKVLFFCLLPNCYLDYRRRMEIGSLPRGRKKRIIYKDMIMRRLEQTSNDYFLDISPLVQSN